MIDEARLIFLDLSAGKIRSIRPDGSDLKVLVDEGRKLPDGLAIDLAANHMYWTNMGNPLENDGAIYRSRLDGRDVTVIVPEGETFTPKQLQLEKAGGKLYWCDREGMRVMRCNLDGSNIETLVDPGEGAPRPGPDATKWCVGIALDVQAGKLYWSQKGGENAGKGRIFRAGIEIPAGETAHARSDIEVLYENLPEPIDIELDLAEGHMYWTDRGAPPRGNTVNRAPIHAPADGRPQPQIVLPGLMEGIGLTLDLVGRRLYVTDLAGNLISANLDGSDRKDLLSMMGNLSGVVYVDPAQPA